MVEPAIDKGAKIYKGKTFRRKYRWVRDGAPFDFSTGVAEVRAMFRLSHGDSSPIFSCSSLSGTVDMTNGALGEIELIISAANTASVSITKKTPVFFDVEVVMASGEVYGPVMGTAAFFPEATY